MTLLKEKMTDIKTKQKKLRPRRNDFRPVHATSYLLFRTNKSQIYIVFTVTVV